MTDTIDKLYLDLGRKPEIQQIGYSIHGLCPEETFLMKGTWGIHTYFWEGELEFQDNIYHIRPQHTSITPPDTPLIWRFPQKRCEHFFAHFHLEFGGGPPVPIPVIQNLGQNISDISQRFEKAIAFHKVQPLRAEILLWDMLWDLSDLWRGNELPLQVISTPVSTVITIVENELRLGPRVAEIARRVGISQNHLNRIFKRERNMTVKRYIQNRRLEKIRHLLEYSNLPIKVIADESGIRDLQHFNKFVKKYLYISPREYRKKFGKDIVHQDSV